MFRYKDLQVAIILASVALGSVLTPGHAQSIEFKPHHMEALEDEKTQVHPGILGKKPTIPGQIGNTGGPAKPKIPDAAKDALKGNTGIKVAPGIVGTTKKPIPLVPGQTGNPGGITIPNIPGAAKGNSGPAINPGIVGTVVKPAKQPALIEPAPASTFAGSSVKFEWDPNGTVVETYGLRFGSTVGGNEHGEFEALPGSNTVVVKGGLPTDGSTVYVRLLYKVAGAWSSWVDYQFTAAPPQLPGQTGKLVDALKPKLTDKTEMTKSSELSNTAVAYLTPVITHMSTNDDYSPGKQILFKGKNFREIQGRVLMYGNFGQPVELFTFWDSDTQVRATIPADITGVVDHLVEFELINDLKISSKRKKTWFIAAREVKKLNRGDPAISLVKCAEDPNINRCHGAHQGDKDINANDCVWGSNDQGKFSHTMWGFHSNCGDIGNDGGKDWWFFGLKNGWKLHSVSVDPTEFHRPSGNIVPNVNDFSGSIGKAIWDVQVLLNISPHDSVMYNYTFNIIGPKGVPHS